MIRAVVSRQLIGFAVEREATFGDAIGVAARDGAEKRAARAIRFGIIKPHHDIAQRSVAVGHFQGNQVGAEIGDLRAGALNVGQRV